MLSKDNTCRAHAAFDFRGNSQSEREDLMQKNVARNASRWNGSQLQEDERRKCGAALDIDNVTRGKI